MGEPREISEAARKRLSRIERNNRRRARNMGQAAEAVDFIGQCEAQDWACCICGRPMDPELPPTDGQSISLEHQIALSGGGHHTASNVKAAHHSCNVLKGQKEDTTRAAKIKRQKGATGQQARRNKAKAAGVSRWGRGRGFQTNKDGPFKQKLGGKTVRRED